MTIHRVGPVTPALDMVSTFGACGPFGVGIIPGAASLGAGARTDYMAIDLPAVHTVRRFWWVNGSDVTGTRTVIMALYADAGFKPGARLASSSATVQTPLNELQFVTPSGGDFTVAPGVYWLAIATSSATNATLFGASVITGVNAAGSFQEATTTPPATATPLEKTSAPYFLCGFSTVASP